mgnify:CR=1 FL=1
MKKNEFILKLDNEIIPAIREQILKAYDDGYTEGHLFSIHKLRRKEAHKSSFLI